MGARRIRRDQRQHDMHVSRITNSVYKNKERVRRQQRILDLIQKQGKLPYTPVVMSYLSAELNKPSRLLTQDDVNKYLESVKK